MIGSEHRAYRELAEELGLTIVPSYVADPGEMSWGLHEDVYVGDELPWMSAAERADLARVDAAFARLAATVDPDDPWSHPEARRLDSLSMGDWLRSEGAMPAVLRRHELASLSLACDSPDRTSVLAELRKHATLAGDGFYDLEAWEGLRVAEGSAEVALRMAAELGPRVRYGSVVEAIDIEHDGARASLATGEVVQAEAVVCALPAGPLRAVRVSGVSDERLASLHAQRHALAVKLVAAYDEPFWQARGQNGLAESEWLFGSTWPQRSGVLSLLVGPERLAAWLATPPEARRPAVLDGLAALYGSEAPLAGGDAGAGVGGGPVHPGLHRGMGSRGPVPGRAAAGHPRAAVLRRRLRPLGGRLHGGRGADRARGGAGRAGGGVGAVVVGRRLRGADGERQPGEGVKGRRRGEPWSLWGDMRDKSTKAPADARTQPLSMR